MQYHDSVNGTTTWADAIAAVKAKYKKAVEGNMQPENNMQPTGADVQVLIRQYPEVGKILETIIISRLNTEQVYEASNAERAKEKEKCQEVKVLTVQR